MKTVVQNTQIEKLDSEISIENLEFAEVAVYNEMADSTTVKLNLLEQINSQLNQLDEMVLKRQFLMKEIVQYIAD